MRTDLGIRVSGGKGVVEEEAIIEGGEWYGYDEDTGEEVSITELKMEFVKD